MCGLGQSHHPCEPQFPSEDAAGRVGDQMGSRVPKGRTGQKQARQAHGGQTDSRGYPEAGDLFMAASEPGGSWASWQE